MSADHHHPPPDPPHHHPHEAEQPRLLSEHEMLEAALRELLTEKGVISAAEVTRQVERMDATTPAQGAMLVARFWSDQAFRARALENGKQAAESQGIDMIEAPELVFLENTPALHHLVVCTLCSCYPRAVLGLPPAWYKSFEYRSRTVIDPRGVLLEFGTEIPEEVEIRVADSTADIRYLVVPVRPPGTEGFSEAHLAELVTRDSMIGVTPALAPSP